MTTIDYTDIIGKFMSKFLKKFEPELQEKIEKKFRSKKTSKLIKALEAEAKEAEAKEAQVEEPQEDLQEKQKYCKVFYLSEKQKEHIKDAVVKKQLKFINSLNFPDCKRGDILSIFPDEERYRNDGLFIYYDKEQGFGELADTEDEYGHIPSEFTIEEFPPRYWEQIITHNLIAWFNPSKHSFEEREKVGENTIVVKEGDLTLLFIYPEGKDPEKMFKRFLKKSTACESHICYFCIAAVELIDIDEETCEQQFPDLAQSKYIVILNNGKPYEG